MSDGRPYGDGDSATADDLATIHSLVLSVGPVVRYSDIVRIGQFDLLDTDDVYIVMMDKMD